MLIFLALTFTYGHLIFGELLTCSHTAEKYCSKEHLAYNNTDVIYLLKCHCGLGCVKKANCTLKMRMIKYTSALKQKDESSPTVLHFCVCNHPISTLQCMVIDKLKHCIKEPVAEGELD